MYGGQLFGTRNSKFFGKYKHVHVPVPFLFGFITFFLRGFYNCMLPGAKIASGDLT